MDQGPTVSVVIPCYNTHRCLGQTILSIREQTFRDLELIVVDDGSTDAETAAYLDSLPGDVRIVRQPNRGLPAARNAGFRQARGDYVLPLDADDWLEPDAIERLLGVLRQSPDAAFSFSYICMEGERSGVLPKHYNLFEQLFLNQLPYCLLLRKSVWEQAGGYDERLRRGYEDWEFNIRLGRLGWTGVVAEAPLFHYRISESGMLLRLSTKLHGELWNEIRRKHAEMYQAGQLVQLWRRWRHQPSTYPLWIYFGWLAVAKLLPAPAFTALFARLRRHSHAVRVDARMSQRTGAW